MKMAFTSPTIEGDHTRHETRRDEESWRATTTRRRTQSTQMHPDSESDSAVGFKFLSLAVHVCHFYHHAWSMVLLHACTSSAICEATQSYLYHHSWISNSKVSATVKSIATVENGLFFEDERRDGERGDSTSFRPMAGLAAGPLL